MRTIESLYTLNIPNEYREYISKYIQNISDIPYISRIFLFGSCAKEVVSAHSDIDFFITTNREISEDEEMLITMYSLPEYSAETIPTDIIVQSENSFCNYINSIGMVQRQVNKEGVDLSGLLHKCS